MSSLIKLEGVSKSYGKTMALSDLNLEIKACGVHGLLGPNGAGKTTLLKILSSFCQYDSGVITQDLENQINYLPEIAPLVEEVSVITYLDFISSLHKSNKFFSVDEIISYFDLKPFKHKIIKYLSKGNKQRVALSQVFLGNPKLIILDEPNVNLDPISIKKLRDLIDKLKKEISFIISSHQLNEIECLAEDITILNQAKCLYSGELSKLIESDHSLEKKYLELVGEK